MTEKKNLMK